MKIKINLRLALLFLFMAIGICCNRNTDSPPLVEAGAPIYRNDNIRVNSNNNVKNQDQYNHATKTDSGSGVYICKSIGAKRYHLSKACRGLIRCEHEIERVSVEEAEGIGLSLCRWED
ncbi:MAG: hypothetical protein PSV16_06090 [Flavobacterium sp.]|nr:hypothetical protein [Flavobacterium sp.]